MMGAVIFHLMWPTDRIVFDAVTFFHVTDFLLYSDFWRSSDRQTKWKAPFLWHKFRLLVTFVATLFHKSTTNSTKSFLDIQYLGSTQNFLAWHTPAMSTASVLLLCSALQTPAGALQFGTETPCHCTETWRMLYIHMSLLSEWWWSGPSTGARWNPADC